MARHRKIPEPAPSPGDSSGLVILTRDLQLESRPAVMSVEECYLDQAPQRLARPRRTRSSEPASMAPEKPKKHKEPHPAPPRLAMSVLETCISTSLSRSTIYRLARAKAITFIKVGTRCLVSTKSLEDYLINKAKEA